MNNPIETTKRWLFVTGLTGGACLIICFIWAMRPLQYKPTLTLPATESSSSIPDEQLNSVELAEPALDPNIFAVTLWHAPPTPETESTMAVEEPPKREPLKFQLVAIIHENGVRHAALYDQTDDRIVIVADGGSIRQLAVHVADDYVEFRNVDGRKEEQLLLRPDEATGRSGEVGRTRS